MDENNRLLYETVAEDICRNINNGVYIPGAVIPVVSALQTHYKVCHLTVLHALKELEKKKLIEKRGRRYYVNDCNSKSLSITNVRLVIGLFVRPFRENSSDNFFNEINLALERSLLDDNFDLLRSFFSKHFNHLHSLRHMEDEVWSNLQNLSRNCAGMVLDERVSDFVIQKLLDANYSQALLVNRCSSLPISSVAVDNANAVEEQLKIIFRLGYNEVIYLHVNSVSDNANDLERYQAMVEFEHNTEQRIIILDIIKNGDYLEFCIDYLNRHAKKKIAIVCFSDNTALQLGNRLLSCGKIPGKDYGLVGFYHRETCLDNGFPLATTKINTELLGRLAAEVLVDKIRHPWNTYPIKKRITSTFLLGKTL